MRQMKASTRRAQELLVNDPASFSLRPDPEPFGLDVEDHPSTRVIAITSGKGGVGKTVLAANLGVFCQTVGKRVVILDADFGLANLDVVLGISAERNIRDVLFGELPIEQVMVEGPRGVRVIPAGSGIRALANLSEDQVLGLLHKLLAHNKLFDILLVDTAAGISSEVSSVLLASDEVIIVTQAEPTAVLDAYAVIKTIATDRPETRVFVVANCVKDEAQGRNVFENLSTVSRRFLGMDLSYAGSVPLDSHIQLAVKMRRPSLIAFPDSASSVAIRSVAKRLLDSDGDAGEDAIGRFWTRLLRGGAG